MTVHIGTCSIVLIVVLLIGDTSNGLFVGFSKVNNFSRLLDYVLLLLLY